MASRREVAVPASPGFLSRQVRTARRFFRDSGSAAETDLHVISAGYEECAPNYVMRRHTFPWLGVELVASGHGQVDLGGQTAALSAGLVFSYGPGVPHAISASADRPPGKWFIDLGGRDAGGLLADAGLAPGRLGMVAAPGAAMALFEVLVDTGRRSGPESGPLLAAIARALLLALAHPGTDLDPAVALAQATYQRCRAWLDAHAASGAGVQQAAAALNLSAAHVTRLFQRFDRVSPGAHARHVRLQQAADQLAASHERIKDIAALSGYADAFHFSRAFSRAFGMSPRAFRAWAGGVTSSDAGNSIDRD